MRSTEFVRYFGGKDDAQKTGRPVSEEVSALYSSIQTVSESKYKEINKAILDLAIDTDPSLFESYQLEQGYQNIQTDAYIHKDGNLYAVEFHHNAGNIHVYRE
jgi:hypothetical protein